MSIKHCLINNVASSKGLPGITKEDIMELSSQHLIGPRDYFLRGDGAEYFFPSAIARQAVFDYLEKKKKKKDEESGTSSIQTKKKNPRIQKEESDEPTKKQKTNSE